LLKDSILLKEVVFENFAQFRNFNIEFPDPSDSGESPILYFLGDNGAGKTRLFNGIKIAIFGIDGVEKNKLANLIPQKIKDEIVKNIKNGDVNQRQRMMFAVILKVNEFESELYYRIQRTWVFDNFKIKDKKLSAKIISDGNNPIVSTRETSLDDWEDFGSDINIKLKEWFPEEAREFFFFDGEKLENMIKGKSYKKKDIIKKILSRTDIPVLNEIFEELNKQKEQFGGEAGQIERKDELTKKAFKRLNKADKALNNNKSQIESKTKEIEATQEKITQLTEEKEQLGLDEARAEMKKKEKEIIKKFNELDKKRSEIYTNIDNALKKNNIFEWMLIESILDEVRADLDHKMKNNIIPTKFDKQIYNRVIESKHCILCDRDLSNNDDLQIIEIKRDEAIDEVLNREARRFIQELDNIKDDINDSKHHINKLIKHFGVIKAQIDALGHIPKQEKDEYKRLKRFVEITNEISKKETKISKLSGEIEDLEGKQPELKKELILARKNYNTKLKQHEVIQDSDLYLQLATDLLDLCNNINNTLESDIINFIIKKTNENFLRLIPKPENYDGMYISKEWNFGFYPKGAQVPIQGEEGPSAGQFHVIGLSFLNALAKVSERTVPILFDTPFGRISREPKANIAKNFPLMFEGTQIIFFLTDAEADRMIDNIKGKKGYEIINIERTQATIEEITDDRLEERVEYYKIEKEKIEEET